jgi:hypothetical protein
VLVADRLSIVRLEGADAAVHVDRGGVALIHDSLLAEVFSPTVAVRNDGLVALSHTSLATLVNSVYAASLAGTGQTFVASSELSGCSGTPPSSAGYNLAFDLSCALTGTGDQQGAVPAFTITLGSPVAYTLPADSALVDAVPSGVNGCGTSEVRDLLGAVRPTDGNGDGIASCDIGPIERPA